MPEKACPTCVILNQKSAKLLLTFPLLGSVALTTLLFSFFLSEHGKAVNACLPSSENAELLREGGRAQPGGTAAEVRRLQSICVHQQGSDPYEGGKMQQPSSVI